MQFDENGEPRYVFLDCGIVFSSKSAEEHKALVNICLAFMKHDGIEAGKLMIDKSCQDKGKRMSKENEEKFCNGIQQMIIDTQNDAFYEHFGEYVIRICDLARNFNVKLDPQYFHVAMALKVVEGVSLSLNKESNLIKKCVPIVVRAQTLQRLGIIKFPSIEEVEKDEKEFRNKLDSKSHSN